MSRNGWAINQMRKWRDVSSFSGLALRRVRNEQARPTVREGASLSLAVSLLCWDRSIESVVARQRLRATSESSLRRRVSTLPPGGPVTATVTIGDATVERGRAGASCSVLVAALD